VVVEPRTSDLQRLTASSSIYLDEAATLRREPWFPERERPKAFYERFEDRALFYDIFRSRDGYHVYLIGPMAMNLEPHLREMRIVGVQSGSQPRVQIHFGLQIVIMRVRLPLEDTHLRVVIGEQTHEAEICPNQSEFFRNERMLVTINKNNRLEWIADWARFYVKEHGASAVILYDNGSTDYSTDDLRETFASVPGLKQALVVPWNFKFGMTDPHRGPKLGGNWVRFAQPPIYTHAFRKYAAKARSIVNVDIDELVISPHRKSVFKAAERAPFGVVRFNWIWVENIREDQSALPRHSQFVVRKRGLAAKNRGKKWAINPRRSWLASWRAQLWTHQVRGWFNLTGASIDFFAYHFIGVTTNWSWDRTATPDFDPKLHRKDKLLIEVFADVFGTPRNR